MGDDIADGLAYYDEGFNPKMSRTKSGDLPNGVYTVFVESAHLEKTMNGQVVVAWVMTIEAGPSLTGASFEHTSWLTSPEAVARFGGELKAIGFETNKWTLPDQPFSKMLPGALRKCVGCRLDVSKTTYTKQDGGIGSNLRLTKGYMPMPLSSDWKATAASSFPSEADCPF